MQISSVMADEVDTLKEETIVSDEIFYTQSQIMVEKVPEYIPKFPKTFTPKKETIDFSA